MTELRRQIHDYLGELLGMEVIAVPWGAAGRLPAFLVDRYEVLEGTILDRPVLFLADAAAEAESPAMLCKHIALVGTKCDWPVVYVRERITAYNRKRLIEHRVPFLVPGNQLFLPDLGIDLREVFRRQTETRLELRPATQAVFIDALLRDGDRPLTIAELAAQLGYSAMSIGRAFSDLVAAGLAISRMVRRERTLALASPPRELWLRAQPFLSTPVRSRHFIQIRGTQTHGTQTHPGELGLTAGLSALAAYSTLAEPKNPVTAVSREQWTALRQRGAVVELPMREPDACEVETWIYSPRPYRGRHVVDPLSLTLSLRPATDERVEQALEQTLESLPW